MQYMLMCCFDEKVWTTLPDEDKESIMREYGELMQSLAKRGYLCGSGKLRSSSAAITWSKATTWTKRSPSRHVFRRSLQEGR